MTPTIVAWMVEATHNLNMPAFYLMGISLIGLWTGIRMPETANKPLRGETPTASDRNEAKEILSEHFDTIEQKVEEIDEKIADLERRRQILIDQHPKLD